MFRVAAAMVAAGALLAGVLLPTALAAPPPVVSAETPTPPATAGANCKWGTEPAGVIKQINYSRGYLYGPDWARDHQSPYECAIGPAWTPIRHGYPLSHVVVSEELYSPQTANRHLCTGLDDPTCGPNKWAEAYAESALGYCAQDSDFNCIESLTVTAPDGQSQQARFMRGFPETPEIPEFNRNGMFMPAGGSVPLWEYDTAEGVQRVLTPGMSHTVFRVENGRWQQPAGAGLFALSLRPVTIESRPGISKPEMREFRTSAGLIQVYRSEQGNPAASGCMAMDVNECALDAGFPEGYRYALSLRMRDSSEMYLNGAVDEPLAYSEKIPGGHRFYIEAGASPVLAMAGWIPKGQIPRSVVDNTFAELGFNYNWEIDFDAASHRPLGRAGADALAWLKVLLPYFDDRASFVVDAWHVENMPNLGQYTAQCVDKSKGEFIGIVSSNATAYTGDPPTYDQSTGTLKYEVAGPHYMPDGVTLSKGRYSINMNADFVKCLLGVDRVPSMARVELIYPDGEASAATLAVKQDKNWLRLYYENFTFSSPTVSVKFPKSLTCFKGTGKRVQSKKFVAFECPKGWRPKR
jgi:hypothetical protein